VEGDDAAIERTVRLLVDDRAAELEGEQLWEANRDLWRAGIVRRQISDWLGL